MVSFWDFVSMGREQWKGQRSLLKAAFFLLLGTPDTHTRLRNSYVINQIEHLDLPPQSHVLEGGFGRAIVLSWLARHHLDWHLKGMELDPVMAGAARRVVEGEGYANVEIVEDDIASLDEEGVYDLAISIDTLEHIEDDLGFLRNHFRALKPGGFLVLHVPKRRHEQWRLIPAFRGHRVREIIRDKGPDGETCRVHVHGHVRDEYTAEELLHVFREAGLEVVDLRETIGRWGEVSFELNNLLWTSRPLRYLSALLTYPLAVPLGYVDVRSNPSRGNSLMVTAVRS
jgi:2-polyprenyl-3-methyl-5-hydroxy-6-metoxy-1,4-benzoquinol methylase